jgi:hypothetical protein
MKITYENNPVMGSGCPFSGVSWARGEGNMDIMDG